MRSNLSGVMPDAAPARAPLELPPAPRRWWIGAVYVLLFAVSVPWYLPASDPVPVWLGLPHWVVIAIVGSAAIAVFTALVVTRFWPTEEEIVHGVAGPTNLDDDGRNRIHPNNTNHDQSDGSRTEERR